MDLLPCDTPKLMRYLTGNRKIVILSPHPDDESLGCGGLLSHCFGNFGAHVICVTDGRASHPNSARFPAHKLARLRAIELQASITTLGGNQSDITHLGYADTCAPKSLTEQLSAAEIVAQICLEHSATSLFTTTLHDPHVDHQNTNRIAYQVQRLIPSITVFEFPIWSRWSCTAALSIATYRHAFSLDIGQWRERKASAARQFKSQRGLAVPDDPSGFVMPPGFIEHFANTNELFLQRSA